MRTELQISVGQHSDPGRKPANQDFYGVFIPRGPQLATKGIAIALADGISSSDVSDVASESAVKGFLEDYYCTSDAWSVKTSALRVLMATNAWLHSQTHQSQWRHDRDRGYVCTFSALVIKSNTAHIFHVGDTRIYRVQGQTLEQLTTDHRVLVTQDESYLSRALGIHPQLDIDYLTVTVEPGDTFVLATDGVYEHLASTHIVQTLQRLHENLDQAAQALVEEALRQGSPDNLTVQVVRIEQLPAPEAAEIPSRISELPVPPLLQAGQLIDGYRVVRELNASHRSHIYLAIDEASGQTVVLKTPSIDQQDDAAYLERFLMEEWVARRIHSDHALRACPPDRKRNHLYVVMEYIEGQTLSQWMIDHPAPSLETVRDIVSQIARGLQAFHRLEMLHQDLRPHNIMIDVNGTVKIIDFGATRVASLMEVAPPEERNALLGTVQYTAPEYFLGEGGSTRSDVFSLGVITYQLLTGHLPYGARAARLRTHRDRQKLVYAPMRDHKRDIPVWIEGALRKAVHPNPLQRYEEAAEFAYDLRHPNREFLSRRHPPLIERNPVAFWKGISLLLALALLLLLSQHPGLR